MGLDTMTSLLSLQLQNERAIYQKLCKEGRKDAIAEIVLRRIEKQIINLEKQVENEENTREKNSSCACTSRFARYIKQAMYRYGIKCYGDNHAIPSIPAIETL